MRLARLCIHDRVDAHGTCPGGEFLPEGALVIEKVEPELIDRIEKHMCAVDRDTSRRLTYHDLAAAALDALRVEGSE